MSCLFNLALNALYIDQIGDEFFRGDSSFYILDSYYYWYLGSVIDSMTSNNIYFLENAFEVAPTLNSTGMVAITSIFNIVHELIYLIPLLFLLVYLFLFGKITDHTPLTATLIAIILITTAPLPFLISKESFLYVGIILIIRASLSDNFFRKFSGIFLGVLFVAIGRFEVLAFLLISYILCLTGPIVRLAMMVISVVGASFYFDFFYEFALIAEKVAISQNNEFCGGISNTACLTSDAPISTVLFTRFLLAVLLPLKWLLTFFESFSYLDDVSRFWARFSQGLFALLTIQWFYMLRRYKKEKLIKLNSKLSKFGFWFFVTYSIFYMLVIFQQPTRQVQFALAIFMIAVNFDAINLIRLRPVDKPFPINRFKS